MKLVPTNIIFPTSSPRKLTSKDLTQDHIWYLNLDEVTLKSVLLLTMLYILSTKIYDDLICMVNVPHVIKL